jgi:uncharacterized protein (TIGR03546 family)
MILKQIFNLLKLLNSETGTNQIAAGVVCGMILGFAPGLSLQTLLVFACVFFFRIQIGAAFGTAIFFKMLAYPLDPVFHQVGTQVLEMEALHPTFVTLYNMPIIPLTRFNNSVTMGAGVLALLLAVPMFFLSKVLIRKYREQVVARFRNTKVWKVVQATSLYKWYLKYEQFRG